jgi:nitrogen fixation protein FixH
MQQARTLDRSGWRFFPWAVAGSMGVVIGVNVVLAVLAARTFPGDVGSDGFTLSNRYNEVMQAARREQGTGWRIVADITAGHARLALADRAGRPLADAVVTMAVRRPLGDDSLIALDVRRDAAGAYVSAAPLPGRGQWDLTVTVTAMGETVTRTQRIVRE